jgi:phage/plasmid primase-like uncharacterized protein
VTETPNKDLFRDFIKEVTGFDPGEIQITPPGRYRRFSTSVDPQDKSGSYQFRGDWGTVKNFRADPPKRVTWKTPRSLSKAERSAMNAEIKTAKGSGEVTDEHRAASQRMRDWYNGLKFDLPQGSQNHPYLEKKNVVSPGLFIDKGELIIPLFNKDRKHVNVQRILPAPLANSGRQKFYFSSGAEAQNLHFIFGEIDDHFIIAEGFATGATLHETTGWPVAITVNAQDMVTVSRYLREFYPTARVIIATDDDTSSDNKGERCAREAAREIGASVSLPPFDRAVDLKTKEYSDWNDYARVYGKDKVSAAFFKCAEGNAPPPPRTFIDYEEGQEVDILEHIENFIVTNHVPIFNNNGRLVTPTLRKYPTSDPAVPTTFSALRQAKHINLVKALGGAGLGFQKYNPKTKTNKTIDTPRAVTSNLLEDGDWSHIHECIGVINTPTMRPDGTLISDNGYDQLTKLYVDFDRSLDMPNIPAQPTQEDAQAALKLLEDLLVDFPFADRELGRKSIDKSCALSSILTAVTRPAYPKAVMVLVSAHAPSSGKSYLVTTISKLAHGRPAPVISYGGSNEEAEKRLDSLLLDALPCFSLDNITRDIEGQKICQMFTEEVMRIRRLGSTDMYDCTAKTTVFATGNNVNFSGDMIRRGMTIHLNTSEARPETRTFSLRPDQLVIRDRGKYIAAALTIVRAYIVSKYKQECDPLASFEGWSQFCREPLLWLGCGDPIASQNTARDEQALTDWRPSFLTYLQKVFDIKKVFTSGDIVEHFNMVEPRSTERDFYKQVISSVAGDGRFINPVSLGRRLKAMSGVALACEDGRVLKLESAGKAAANVVSWKVTMEKTAIGTQGRLLADG